MGECKPQCSLVRCKQTPRIYCRESWTFKQRFTLAAKWAWRGGGSSSTGEGCLGAENSTWETWYTLWSKRDANLTLKSTHFPTCKRQISGFFLLVAVSKVFSTAEGEDAHHRLLWEGRGGGEGSVVWQGRTNLDRTAILLAKFWKTMKVA